MINQITQQNKISFQSIKPSLRIGEEAIRGFRQEFPGLRSSTNLALRIGHLPLKCHTKTLIANLWAYHKRIQELMVKLRTNYDYYPFQTDFTNFLAEEVKKLKVANCGEMANLVQGRLLEQGIRTDRISMEIEKKNPFFPSAQKRPFNDHYFLVLGLSRKASLKDPKTWGSKAVIIDPWFQETSPAHEMLRKYLSPAVFDFDEDTEEIIFSNVNHPQVTEIFPKIA